MDKNEAIEILRKGYPDINRYAASELEAYEYDVEAYNEAVGCAISHLEADRWIPVSERLPDKNGNYLVCLNNGGITTDIFDEEELFMGFWGYMTHWRPLPKAPESEENK